MRFMMEADNLCCITLTAYFLKQICHRHLNKVPILTFYCTDIVKICSFTYNIYEQIVLAMRNLAETSI